MKMQSSIYVDLPLEKHRVGLNSWWNELKLQQSATILANQPKGGHIISVNIKWSQRWRQQSRKKKQGKCVNRKLKVLNMASLCCAIEKACLAVCMWGGGLCNWHFSPRVVFDLIFMQNLCEVFSVTVLCLCAVFQSFLRNFCRFYSLTDCYFFELVRYFRLCCQF